MSELERYIHAHFDTDGQFSAQLAKLFEEERIARGAFHTREGNRRAALSFVKSGFLRVYRQTDKKEVTQWISSPGEFTTDLNALMFGQPARWNIQALTDCELYTLRFSDYQRIQELIPEWPQIEKLFIGKCFVSIEERVFSFLSMSAEERYTFFYENRRDLFQQIPQQYIASMLGMTPETFSRIRSRIVS